ncbi:MAG: ATP-binding protein, partial [Longimicrobiales bacterium]
RPVLIAPDPTPAADISGGDPFGHEPGPARAAAEGLRVAPESAESAGSAGPPVFWLDLQGRISRWSRRAEHLFGYEGGEAIGLRFSDLFTQEEREAHKPELALARAREFGCWDETGWRVSRGGDRIWTASSLALVRTPNGLEIGYQVLTRDLTATDGAEGAAAHQAEEVLRLLSMGRVASDVAHELNNLLAALRGFACVLERHLPPGGTPHEAWRQMLKACDRGTDLTRKMLGLGKPGDGGLQAVDPIAAVRDLEPLLRQVLPDRILLVTSLPADLPRVTARARDIDLALLNLVVNARDAIEASGTVAIQVRLENGSDGAEPRVVVSVTDSGAGMAPEVQHRAFERFFTTKGPEHGTGLGLSLVRDAVRSWGGSVELTSTPGTGTCVSLKLMLAEPAALPQSTQPGIGRHTLRRPRPQVMLCAPRPTRDLVADLLTRRGYGVVSVEGHEEARRLLAIHGSTVDLVVAGGPIASGEGADLVDVLRRMPSVPPAVVFFAAEPGPVTSPWASYPACRFLWGPILPDLLFEEIERSLDAAPLRQATAIH